MRVSKRNGKCFFDQLLLPPDLTPYMGRPSVTRGELRQHGIDPDAFLYDPDRRSPEPDAADSTLQPADRHLGHLQRLDHGPDSLAAGVDDDESLWPCSRVWGMGFAWSSFVGQETLLQVCGHSGLHEDLALAMSRPVPAKASLFFSLATDDVMRCSSKGPGVTLDAAKRLDKALAAAGIQRHVGKDENDVLDSTSVGVCLRAGRWWWPPAARMWSLILGALHLCKTGVGSSTFSGSI